MELRICLKNCLCKNQRDWKAELELEQYRNIIKMEKIEKRMQIEKGGRWVYNKYE